jgi:hypothetical protein
MKSATRRPWCGHADEKTNGGRHAEWIEGDPYRESMGCWMVRFPPTRSRVSSKKVTTKVTSAPLRAPRAELANAA